MGGWDSDPSPFAQRIRDGYGLLADVLRREDAGEVVDYATELADAPGVRLAPTSWEELRERVAKGGPEVLGQLGRSPAQLRAYFGHRDTVIKAQYASVADYLHAKVFGLPTAPGPDGRLVAQVPPDFAASRRTVWRDNDFPYLLEEGVVHLNYWSSQPLSATEVEERIAAELPTDAEYVWFVNPPVLQSVPTIWHAHIMWRRRPADAAAAQQQVEQRLQGGERQWGEPQQ
eukprot:scaffold1.g5891.t1